MKLSVAKTVNGPYRIAFRQIILKIDMGLDVRESVHRDTTMKITNKMHYID